MDVLTNPASSSSVPIQDRMPLLRREAATKIMADAKRNLANTFTEDEPHKNLYEENPSFTPEAIFANKGLAPEIAEFLGHLAQKSRVHHTQVNRAAQEDSLLAEGRAPPAPDSDKNDDNDDIEDMKRAAAAGPKKTVLSQFLQQLDSKTKAESWLASDCSALAANITDKYEKMIGKTAGTWGTVGPAGAAGRKEIHTGMFFKHWGAAKRKESARKLRLGVLSFLATQDAGRAMLHIWTDLDKQDKTIQEVLGPIAHHPEYMDAIKITTFDHKAEFAKVPPSLAKATLTERYEKHTMPSLRSDLFRSVILYNYGGMWMDADTVLMQDVSPLFGEDWAHLVNGKEGAIEGALLSASKPASHFANAYLISMVMRDTPLDGEKQKPLLVDIFNNDPAHTTMHVLPPCFLDSEPLPDTSETAVLSSGASLGSVFFGKPVAEPYRAFFSIGISDALKDTSSGDVSVLQDMASLTPPVDDDDDDKPAPTSPVWAYHWRGNFGASWARGSLADVAERTFMRKLRLAQAKPTLVVASKQ